MRLMDHAYCMVCFRVDVITCVCVSGWMSSPVCVFQGGCHHLCACFRVDVITCVCVFQGGCHHLCVCFRLDGIICVRDRVDACFMHI